MALIPTYPYKALSSLLSVLGNVLCLQACACYVKQQQTMHVLPYLKTALAAQHGVYFSASIRCKRGNTSGIVARETTCQCRERYLIRWPSHLHWRSHDQNLSSLVMVVCHQMMRRAIPLCKIVDATLRSLH
nr:hypothetical protein CFP56_30740 [Quercus suber]